MQQCPDWGSVALSVDYLHLTASCCAFAGPAFKLAGVSALDKSYPLYIAGKLRAYFEIFTMKTGFYCLDTMIEHASSAAL